MTSVPFALLAAQLTAIAILNAAFLAGAFVFFLRRTRKPEVTPEPPVSKADVGIIAALQRHAQILETFDQSNVLLWWATVTADGKDWKWEIRTPTQVRENPVYRLACAIEKGGLWLKEHAPDRERMDATMENAIKNGSSGYQQEFRILGSDGLHW